MKNCWHSVHSSKAVLCTSYYAEESKMTWCRSWSCDRGLLAWQANFFIRITARRSAKWSCTRCLDFQGTLSNFQRNPIEGFWPAAESEQQTQDNSWEVVGADTLTEITELTRQSKAEGSFVALLVLHRMNIWHGPRASNVNGRHNLSPAGEKHWI